MDAYLSAYLMAADLMAACLIALVLDGSLLGESVAAALQFIAKALACMPLSGVIFSSISLISTVIEG